MKVLLSAYACEPGKGSEPAVGWGWAMEVARLGNDTWVLTRANNRPNIEKGLAELAPIQNLHFLYYDLPRWLQRLKNLPGCVHLYYLLWQWRAYIYVKKIHVQERFELVHHVTFVSVRTPSLMGNLGIPFILGPLAGGETVPWALRLGYGWLGLIKDGIRDFANVLVRIDPITRNALSRAEYIYVNSRQTLLLLPRVYRVKAAIQLAVGIDDSEHSIDSKAASQRKNVRASFRVLYVGQFIYLKGLHLGLAAFAQLLLEYPEARLTMVGKGPAESKWRSLAVKLRISEQIDWVPWLPQEELAGVYSRHDVLLFPSLRDSGGFVVLEAMTHGLPVICFDLGGPGVMVTQDCGCVIETTGRNSMQVIESLAAALIQFARKPDFRRVLGENAAQRVKELAFDRLVKSVYSKLC